MKMGDDGGGSLISPDGVVPSWIVGVSASDISSCIIKSRKKFLLAPVDPGGTGKKAVKWLCVCVAIQVNNSLQLECGLMPNVMAALLNIGGALCSTPQSLVVAHCWSTVQ